MYLIIIKITEDYKKFINHLESSFENNSKCFYNTTGKNKAAYDKIYNEIEHKQDPIDTIFVIHKNNIPKQVYICKSQRLESNSNIICKDIFLVDNKKDTINNFLKDEISLNLQDDFDNNVYIFKTDISETTYLNFLNKVLPPYEAKGKSVQEQNYESNKLEKNMELHPLAQKNEYCIRPLSIQQEDPYRSEFQRDRERIIHAKAYRRLVDKAQIFTSSKGDHYRTRMTHTLEVSQIARGISLRLKLNPDLTEAIALGHDIGHTPFGHQGERTIDAILKGDIDMIPDAISLKIGGFKHNYQSLRVLTYLEEKYIEHEGLDLSYQTLEGILKHTKCDIKKYNIEDFLVNGNKEYLYLDVVNDNEKHFSVTLEGQVVAIADEIAQRGHDLDDAFASGLLSLDSFKDACATDEMKHIRDIVASVESKVKIYKKKRRIIADEMDMIRAMLVPKILGFLIDDVAKTSLKNMNNYDLSFFKINNRVDKRLIEFSDKGKVIVEYLEKNVISKYVINSYEVSRFDTKGEYIIKALFEAYYKNPKLLPDSMLQRLKKEFSKISVNVIDFRLDKSELVLQEVKEITQITKNQLKDSTKAEEYKKKRKILARCIADHISGMTDNYALNEYSKLFESFSGYM